MALIGITTASLVMSAFALMGGFALVDSIESGLDTTYEIVRWQATLESFSGLYTLSLVCSVIAFFAWLSRAVDNTPALGGGTPEFSPRASIGWWFVPFANLVQGYRIVADLWRRTALQPAQGGTALVLAWWLVWLGGNFAANVITRGAAPYTIDGTRTYLTIGTVAYLVNATSGVLLLRIVWLIEQRAKARALALANLSAPPVTSSPGVAAVPTAPTVPSGTVSRVAPVASHTHEFCRPAVLHGWPRPASAGVVVGT